MLSVLSPIISEFMRGCFTVKAKKLDIKNEAIKRNQEFYEEHRAIVIERYIKAVGNAISVLSIENETDYTAAMGEAYLYIDKELWPLIEEIHSRILNGDESVINSYIKLCKKLSSENVRTENKDYREKYGAAQKDISHTKYD